MTIAITERPFFCRLSGIHKRFGGVHALRGHRSKTIEKGKALPICLERMAVEKSTESLMN